MKICWLAVVGFSVASLTARPDQSILNNQDLYLIELGPGETRWITEDEKWALRRGGVNFMDITDTPDLGALRTLDVGRDAMVQFPSKPVHNDSLTPLLERLKQRNMHKNLEVFTSFHTRYYKSTYGAESSAWLYSKVNKTIHDSGAGEFGARVETFEHSWGQNSIIATIPGKSDKTVVIGAHQDSINLFLPSILSAPGADDDGSGTVTILETLRVLLESEAIIKGNASNTVEFHWYSAEEGGLLGSQAIFSAYEKEGRDVKAMLQQDMTGYTHKTTEAGEPESVGVITDFVNPQLTEFIKKIITQYCSIPYVLTKCGYACSDHASASKAGYPSAFVIESDFKYSDNKIHTSQDKIEFLNFVNPFAKRESLNRRSIVIFRFLTLFTWLLVLVLSVFFNVKAPANGKTIWDQNRAHPTPFSLNPEIASFYWLLLLLLQFGYLYCLFTFDAELVKVAANVGSHFILHNLLTSAFIPLWVYSYFWLGELMLVINSFNLTSLYFRHLRTQPLIHIPVVTGPLAWNFVAVLSNGAAMVGAQALPARIVANVAIWSILLYGIFFMGAFKDYPVGFELAILSTALAVHQHGIRVFALQWVFAVAIAMLLTTAALAISLPPVFGKELIWRRLDDDSDYEDREREPLLESE
ncbi:MAG: Leucine aminopeptidase 1 [Alectoria sarmentosa]|nr:MAG: Leucine aminopeptidase 1 [Alectoria sarmentosa]